VSGQIGRLLPYNEILEPISERYMVFRADSETDSRLARRAALAICEAIEVRTQEIATMEAELDIVLAFERRV
jgi:hypothetical protein